MKKIMFLFAAICVSGVMSAVEPLLVDGKSWLIEEMKIEATPGGSIYGSYEKYYRDYTVTVAGDTLVGESVCKVLEKEYLGGEKSRLCAYENDGKIYSVKFYWSHDETSYVFVPLMDFNLEVGKTLPVYSYEYSELQDLGYSLTVNQYIDREVDGRTFKEWVWEYNVFNKTCTWVEGVGSSAANWLYLTPRASALGCDMLKSVCWSVG